MANPTERTRPDVWVGHILVAATDLAASAAFYISLGMREIERNDHVVVLELRGGTHLVIVPVEPAAHGGFDLMVEDLDATHAEWAALGLDPTAITRGRIHDTFTVDDPPGTTITVNSSHVVGTV